MPELNDWQKIHKSINDGGCCVISDGDIPVRVIKNDAGAATRFAMCGNDTAVYEYIDFFNRQGERMGWAQYDKSQQKWEIGVVEGF